ncbi:MAG TPA: YdeI/OmpD-associated family protein [Gemmatimonadaceae bacterium]
MGKRDKRVDAYIAKAPEFAKPILSYIREAAHEGCPDVEEDLKWQNPAFTYKGLLAGMAAFKEHCVFGFWKGELVTGEKTPDGEQSLAMYRKVSSLDDLPPKKKLAAWFRKARELNDAGVKAPRVTKPKKPLAEPDYFLAAIRKNRKALATYENFSPSHKREYIEWITDAKGEETRARRVKQAVEWMAEGKARNWKYM